MPQRLITLALLSLAATTGARDAAALGFGRAQPSATLGYPLDFSVAMRLEGGEVLRPECVSAEVAIGDAPLSRTLVGASVESQAGVPSICVRTNAPIDEPIVSVTVTAGCEAKISRRFTLFADPPPVGAPVAPVVADIDALTATAMAAMTAPEPARDATAGPAAAARAPAAPATPAARAALSSARPVAAQRVADNTNSARRPKPAKTRVAKKQGQAPVLAKGPRLRLEAEPTMMATLAAASVEAAASAAQRETALQAALQSAEQSASAAQASASAAAAQVAALQAGMEALKRDSQANREQMQRLSQALAESQSRSQWTPLLWAALAALLGAVGWLAFKLRQARRETEAWWSAQPAAAAVAVAEGEPSAATSAAMALAQPDTMPPSELPPAAAAAEWPLAAVERTAPLPQALLVQDPPARDVSIEELLDLEQQAEFFIVLGQDEAAIDLLVGHLRSNGGTSPLPYLKLMDIYRRRGEEEAYERTRGRFNHRFNAVAPAWAADQGAGRTLDAYPEVVKQLQRTWASPVDAMTELETLLFRTDSRELFDLPAYREVLFLYSLSRDLLEQGDRAAARIDVLLPLAQGKSEEDFRTTTAARPYLNTDLNGPVDLVLDDPATAPVDLDLTDRHAARATSDFGFFEDKPARVS